MSEDAPHTMTSSPSVYFGLVVFKGFLPEALVGRDFLQLTPDSVSEKECSPALGCLVIGNDPDVVEDSLRLYLEDCYPTTCECNIYLTNVSDRCAKYVLTGILPQSPPIGAVRESSVGALVVDDDDGITAATEFYLGAFDDYGEDKVSG